MKVVNFKSIESKASNNSKKSKAETIARRDEARAKAREKKAKIIKAQEMNSSPELNEYFKHVRQGVPGCKV